MDYATTPSPFLVKKFLVKLDVYKQIYNILTKYYCSSTILKVFIFICIKIKLGGVCDVY
jgi:hypothetical protein